MTALAPPPSWLKLMRSRTAFDADGTPRRRRPRVGLALSGGGAKAAAHVGVLRALLRAGINFDLVAGTSGGALAGLFLCDGHAPDDMLAILKSEFTPPRFWNWLPGGRYWYMSRFLKHGGLRGIIDRHVKARRFADLTTPLFVTSTDLVRGEAVIHQSGELAQAVMASMSLPGFTPPIADGDRLLVDGGVLNYLPAEILRMSGADVVIGVDLGGCNAPADEWSAWNGSNAVQILQRAWAIQNRELARRQLEQVDVIIRPQVAGFSLADLVKMDRLAQLGEKAGVDAVPHILRAIEQNQNELETSQSKTSTPKFLKS